MRVAQSVCSVFQLVVRRLAERQPGVRFSASHSMEVHLAERRSDEDIQEDGPRRMVKGE